MASRGKPVRSAQRTEEERGGLRGPGSRLGHRAATLGPALSPALPPHRHFSSSVASASAGLLGLVVILLHIFTQFFVDPEKLCTDSCYKGVPLPLPGLCPLSNRVLASLSTIFWVKVFILGS